MLRQVLKQALFQVLQSHGCNSVALHRNLATLPDHVKIEVSPTKAVITINCPKVLNAVNVGTIKTIYDQLKQFEAKKKLVIMNAICDQSFALGGDIEGMIRFGLAESKNCFREVYAVNYLIQNYSVPYIALSDGATMGSGSGLFIQGPYRVVTERTTLAMPETAFGLFPHVGNSHFLSRLANKLGLYLALTGHELRGPELVTAGIATHYIESQNLSTLKSELIKCNDTELVPEILNKCTVPAPKEYSLTPHLGNISSCFNERSVEGIFKNLEDNGSPWAKETLEKLNNMSPMSLKLTHRQFDEASYLSLAESLKMEFRMVSRLENCDFREGVKSIIVNKGKPKWNPPDLTSVKYSRVADFFAKLPPSEELQL